MGAGLGVGCTHAALACAYYTADILKAKTALVEIGKNRALFALSEDAEEMYDDLSAFIYEGIHVFCNVSKDYLTGILNGNFDYVFLDITDNEKPSVEEFMRAERKFLVCSLSKWRIGDLENCIDRIFPSYGNNNIKLVTSIAVYKTKKTALKGKVFSPYSIETYAMPFIADPFDPDKSHMGFFKELLSFT